VAEMKRIRQDGCKKLELWRIKRSSKLFQQYLHQETQANARATEDFGDATVCILQYDMEQAAAAC
jgi:hypothetical protein